MQAQLTQILATTVEANHPFIRPIEAKNGFYGVESSKIVATEVCSLHFRTSIILITVNCRRYDWIVGTDSWKRTKFLEMLQMTPVF